MKATVNSTQKPGLRDIHGAVRLCNDQIRLLQEEVAILIEENAKEGRDLLGDNELFKQIVEIEALQRVVRAFGG
jgi:hypothetical protein